MTAASCQPLSSSSGSCLVHAARFGPSQDLSACLREFVRSKRLQSAFVMSCVGSVSRATLRMAFSEDEELSQKVVVFEQHYEIVSLVGTFSQDAGQHLHISLSDVHGRVVGGHVAGELIIHTTAEVVLGSVQDTTFLRRFDPATGFKELVIRDSADICEPPSLT